MPLSCAGPVMRRASSAERYSAVHGCIGLHFWLRMRAFYKRAAPFLLATAVLIPTLSMLGLFFMTLFVTQRDSETVAARRLATRAGPTLGSGRSSKLWNMVVSLGVNGLPPAGVCGLRVGAGVLFFVAWVASQRRRALGHMQPAAACIP